MALVIKDRIKETTTTTGTGDMSLGGADATFDTFSSCMSNSDTTYYAIVHTTYNTDEWEVGLGTYNSSTNALERTTVLAGSNGTSAVNFSAGDKNVFVTFPADVTAGRAILGLGTAATADTTNFVAVTGDTMTGNLSFGDNNKAVFGAGSDLQIWHDGNNSVIRDTGTGELIVNTNAFQLANATNTETMLRAVEDGAVSLYYDSSTKLATTATGVDITGTLSSDGLTVDGIIYIDRAVGYGGIEIGGPDGAYIDFKAPFSDDYDGRIITTGTNLDLISLSGHVKLFEGASVKLETSATGVDINGSLDVTDAATTRTNLDVDQAGTALALAIALG